MSARLFKKVVQQQEQQQQHRLGDGEEEDETEKDSPVSASRPSINPFDLLNDEEEDNEVEVAAVAGSNGEGGVKNATESVADSDKKSKNKKKSKKKKGKGDPSLTTDKADKLLGDAFQSLSLDFDSSAHQHDASKSEIDDGKLGKGLVKQTESSVLQVDPKCLNPENELRRIFGSKVVKSFERSNQAGGSRQVRGGRRGPIHARKTLLVTPADHWPRWDGSLSMEFLERKNGFHYFRYVHSSSYAQAQSAFEAAKATHDLNSIASILMHHPYHLDSLITMADYFKFVGEHQMSADAVAKSLYAMECAWHPMFTPLQGNCCLKISHETNKPLFTTLFTHMKNLDRRGCHRSALEICKLLLSLDSDDPMGSKFCIDYFALRSEEYAWLEQFSEDYERDNSLWLFPNFSFSLAICRFYLEREQSMKDACKVTTKAASTDLMKQALMLYPSVIKKLVAKVPLKDQAWTKIVNHTHFRAEKTGSPSLEHLINIYVERSYIIWRLPDVQKLLRDAAFEVIETLQDSDAEAKDWACVRKEVFSSENNEYSHLLVSDFSDTVPTLPPENVQNFMVDPRMREVEINDNQIANLLNEVPAPRGVENRNPLAVLFESMLPWVHYGDGVAAEVNQENQADGHLEDNEG